jgi:import inner membrane translocase subunit TIM9
MYNGLVERCFTTCVDSFRRKTLEKTEEQARRLCLPPRLLCETDARAQCVTKCCEKFLKHSARVSVRFAELNAGQEQPK